LFLSIRHDDVLHPIVPHALSVDKTPSTLIGPQVAIKDDEEEERKELAAAEDAARRTTIDVLFLNGGHLYHCAPGWSASSLLTFSNP
jgi:hypothetical protein